MYECIQNLYSISFLLFRGFTTDLGGGILQEFTTRNLKLFCKDSCRLRMESWSFCCYLCWCSPISLEDWINFFLLGYNQVGGIFFFFFHVGFLLNPNLELILVHCSIFILISSGNHGSDSLPQPHCLFPYLLELRREDWRCSCLSF